MERQPTLETERLVLRPLAETDREALFGIASDPAVWEQHPIHDRWRRAFGLKRGAQQQIKQIQHHQHNTRNHRADE